ncbi:MAG: dTMP kinase [Candidatus Buchananbacteria bacterium]
MSNKPGLFLVFTGGEGCGKTTQAQLLHEWLLKNGRNTILTKEPGGDLNYCQKIRQLLLTPFPGIILTGRAELLLYLADRAQHIDQTIIPNLEAGKIVICDRYNMDSYAYQCIARKACTKDEFIQLNNFVTRSLVPHFTFWLDLDPKIAFARKNPNLPLDRLESEGLAFHQQVRKGFANFLANPSLSAGPYLKIDAGQTKEEIFKKVLETTKRLLT